MRRESSNLRNLISWTHQAGNMLDDGRWATVPGPFKQASRRNPVAGIGFVELGVLDLNAAVDFSSTVGRPHIAARTPAAVSA